MMAWSLSVSALQSMHFLVSGLVNLMTGNNPGWRGVLDISLGGEVRLGPSYPDPV